jgi:hypothetical protein
MRGGPLKLVCDGTVRCGSGIEVTRNASALRAGVATRSKRRLVNYSMMTLTSSRRVGRQ